MLIRQMEGRDIPAVAELEKQVFSMPWSAKALEESLQQNHYIFLVAEIEGSVAGYMGLYQVLDEADVTNVAVGCQYRRRGIGAALLTRALEMVQDRGIVLVNLEVRAGNAGAIALYEKAGFQMIGRRKGFYEKPMEDAILMQWQAEGNGADYQ